nr:PDZ domain-containing protein [Propionibacterium sp.]
MPGPPAARGRRRSGLISGGIGALTALAILGGASLAGPALVGRSAVTPAAPTPVQTQPATSQVTVSGRPDVTDAQSRGVVLINTTTPGGSGAGTGMVIDAAGLILTNYHVVQGSTHVEVTVASTGASYPAVVVGHDAGTDVALLQVDATGLATVTLDHDPVAVGDPVTAVGNAQGQEFLTAAAGTVTDTSESVTVSNDSAAGSETLTGVYVTDAAAEPGDSGGPLFDAQTEVTGMTTAGQQAYVGPRSRTRTATVATYAIPIARAMAVVDQIRAGQETAQVRIGPNAYLGVTVGSTGPRATSGVGVTGVAAGTPAAAAGLTAGSTITAIGGAAVTSQAELAAALAGHNPGDKVVVSWRDASGTARSAQVTLGESPVN